MAKFDYRTLTEKERQQMGRELAKLFDMIKSQAELENFLQQFLTPSEVAMLARRWRIAQDLVDGKSYLDIREAHGVGLSTIQMVDQWLLKELGDYRAIAEREQKQRQSGKQKKRRFSEPREGIRHKYPTHFLLLNLLLDY